MKNNTDLKLLEQDYLENLVNYIEGATEMPVIFELNEQIYVKSPEILSKPLIFVTTQIHELKVRIDEGEQIDNDTITKTICDAMLKLTSPH